jgi:hypothetical protein
MMKKTRGLQQNLFNMPAAGIGTRLPRNIQTAPLKPLLQALLADLTAAQRPVPAPPSRTDEVDA